MSAYRSSSQGGAGCIIAGLLVGALTCLGLAAVFLVMTQTGAPRGVRVHGPSVGGMNVGFLIAGVVLVPVGLLLVGIAVAFWRKGAQEQRLIAEGVPGQARILHARQTNLYVNRQPQVELELQITTTMHGSYSVTRREVVPMIHVGRLTSGQPLPVMVDRTRPDQFVILWDAPITGPELRPQ